MVHATPLPRRGRPPGSDTIDPVHPSAGGDGADPDPPDDAESDHASPAPEGFDRWRRETALGALGTGVARGLHAVFAPPVDEPVIVASMPGEPPDADQRLRVILDPDDPSKSVAIVPEPPDGRPDG
jgi:hypothetical protein